MTDDEPQWWQTANWRRVGAITTALGVGAIAGVSSYTHLREVAITNGQPHVLATLFPLSTDLLIVSATLAMDGHNRFWPRVAFWAGVGATISGNVLSALHIVDVALAIAVATWTPLALLISIEMLVPRKSRQTSAAAEVPAAKNAQAESPTVTAETVTAELAPKPRTPNKRGAATTAKVTRVARKMPDAPAVVIAAKSGVSESTARRVMQEQKAAEFDAELAAMDVEVPA